MKLSISEYGSLAKLAAKGAGMPWSVASETAMAVQWLAAMGVPVCDALADAVKVAPPSIDIEKDRWGNAEAGPLNPLFVGPSLADFGVEDGLSLPSVASPVFICPFVAELTRNRDDVYQIGWGQASAVVFNGRLCRSSEIGTDLTGVFDVSIARASQQTEGFETCARAEVKSENFEYFQQLAANTYAPATEESRRLGAG